MDTSLEAGPHLFIAGPRPEGRAELQRIQAVHLPRSLPKGFPHEHPSAPGAAERVFHYYNLANPCAFSFTLHLDTPISEAGLRNAVAGLQRSHPLLRATVSQNETGEPIWVSTTDPVPVRSAPGAS